MAKKKIETNESYEKMADTLDMDFEGEEDIEKEVDKSLEKVDKIKNELVDGSLATYTLEDAKYMEVQIKKSLSGLEHVSDRLEQEIKVGSKASLFEVYATLANSKMNAIRELREMRKIIVDLKIQLEKPKQKSPKNVTVNNFMSAKDVDKMIKSANQKSLMNEVDATFNVEEE